MKLHVFRSPSLSAVGSCRRDRTAFTPPTAALAPHSPPPPLTRRQGLASLAGALAGAATLRSKPALADDFTSTPSGLRFLDLRQGEGATPQAGDTCVVDWAGYTEGYQGKRIGNTTTDKNGEPYTFVLGASEAIPAFEEAVSTMKVGGVRRIQVLGDCPQLSYPRDRKERFLDDFGVFHYRFGPQPPDLGGQRALDFVLDEKTLQDFNRTLLFDVKLVSVRPKR